MPVATETPGPGAYGRSLSPKDSALVIGTTVKKPGKSFGKSGMTRDNSGIRQLFPVPSSTKARTRKPSHQMGDAGTIPREVSLMSLKQRNQVMAAESKTSIHFVLNSSPSMRHDLKQENSVAKLYDSDVPFRAIFKDTSVTRLSNGPLVSDMARSTDKLQTVSQAIASITSSRPNFDVNNSKMSKMNKSPSNRSMKGVNQTSSKNLYSMDLGTMGIPREVAHMRAMNNPLYTSDNRAGPGDFDPQLTLTAHHAPVVGFGKLKSKNLKTTQNQWEEKMEQYVGVKPGDNKTHH